LVERVCVERSIVIAQRVLVIVERACGVKRVIGIVGGVIVDVESWQHFAIFTAVNVES